MKNMDSSIPCERQRTEPYCIIRCTDENTNLISPNSLDSWAERYRKLVKSETTKAFLMYRWPMTKSRMQSFTIANVEARLHTNMPHDLDRIEKSNNERKKKEVENSHPKRSSTRQRIGCMFAECKNKINK